MRRTFLLAASVSLLGGCATLRQATGIGLERPRLDYESWSADSLDLEGVTISLHYKLQNPNDFGLDLRHLAYRLEVEGSRVAEGELPSGLQVRAKGATPVAVPVRLRWRDIPGFTQILLARDSVAYRVSGDVGVASPLGVIDLPFDHQDRVALPRLPALRVEGLSVREASVDHLALDLRLRVENRNSFPLPVGALTYGLRVGDHDLVSGSSHPLAAVPSGGQATVTIPLRLSTVGATQAVGDLLRGAEVRLRGLAGYGPIEAPVDAPGRLAR